MVDAKEKHVFVVVKFFHSQKVDFSSFHIPLEFLPLLAKKDAKLHDIIVDTVALMLKQKHVNLWDVEEYSKRALEHTLRITCKSPKEIDELEIYQRGDAMKYLKLIRKRSKVVTNDSVLKMFASYIPDSERKRMTLNWVKMLINLNKYKERMNQFDWYPHYANPSNPFTASKKYFFVWSIHRNSSIQKKADYFYKDDDKKSGEYLPAQVSITSPGQVYKTPVESSYPEDIHAAMKFGWSVLINRFGQYYFKAKDLNEHSLSLQLFNKEKYGTTRSK
jgi:hypothetical protein